MKIKSLLGYCVLTLLLVSSATAKNFPERAITLIVNYGSGGPTDLSARALSKAVEEIIKVPVVVINRPGATGSAGVIELKGANNDGYTVGLLTYAPMVVVPHQTKVPYTPEDFDYLQAYGEYRYTIVVKASAPYQNIDDLVAAAKAKPGGLTFSASGYPQRLVMKTIGAKKKCKFRFVPYESGAEAVTAIVGGHVNSSVAIVTDILPFVKSGELRVLASASNSRINQAPEVPTLKELGYDVSIQSWIGLGVPAGVPKERRQVLCDAFKKGIANPKFIETMKKLSIPIIYMPGEDYRKQIEAGYRETGAVSKEMGLAIN